MVQALMCRWQGKSGAEEHDDEWEMLSQTTHEEVSHFSCHLLSTLCALSTSPVLSLSTASVGMAVETNLSISGAPCQGHAHSCKYLGIVLLGNFVCTKEIWIHGQLLKGSQSA